MTIALIVPVLTAACGGTEGDPNPTVGTEVRIISQVLGDPSTSDIEIRWFPTSCEAFERLDVTEGESEIEIIITVLVDAGACDVPEGEASTNYTLATSLGDRIIVDGNLGSTVALNAEPGPPDQ